MLNKMFLLNLLAVIGRILRSIVFVILFLSVTMSYSYAAVDDSYLPRIYDGYRYITKMRSVNITNGNTTTTNSISYHWVDGTKWINGVECFKSYESKTGFNTDIINVFYSTYLENESRLYGSDTYDGRIRYNPYYKSWEYGLEIGESFSINYSSTSTYNNQTSTSNSSGTITLIGYESLSTPYGSYRNCLKVRESYRTRTSYSGHTSTVENELIFWYAKGIGVVKQFTQGDGWQLTQYYSREILSEPQQPPIDILYGSSPLNTGYAWSYPSIENPIKETNPADCNPFAVGDLASGNLSLQVGLPAFSSGVDVYLAIGFADALFLVDDSNVLHPASELTVLPRWKTNNTAAIDESLYGDIPISLLPSGVYNLYTLVVPTGETNFNHFYFWSTSFNVGN